MKLVNVNNPSPNLQFKDLAIGELFIHKFKDEGERLFIKYSNDPCTAARRFDNGKLTSQTIIFGDTNIVQRVKILEIHYEVIS